MESTQSLVFPAGLAGAKDCANISIVDDLTLEDEEMFFVVLGSTDPNVRVPSSPTTVVIQDQDSKLITF